MVALKAVWRSHFLSCDWYFIYSMVVGVRKNMMLLFENKLSYILCVVGAGVTNAEWAWWFGRSLWVATIPSNVNTAQNIHDFALWYSRFSVDCLLAAPMVVGAVFLMRKCISSYLDCQYDSLSIDKCSKIRHRGPCCEEMLTNEEFIMKKKNSVSSMIITFTPSLL